MGLGNSSLFMFAVEGCNDEFRVVEFKGREQISSPFYFTVAVACPNFELSTSSLVNKPACLTFSAEEAPRYVHGLIVNIELINTGRRFASYSITLAPKLWWLEQRSQMKIFQQQDASQIIKTLLTDAGLQEGNDFKIEISGSLPQRTYTTQYIETDLEFFNRILAEDGLHYHFTFEQDRHVLIISDTQYIFKRLPITPEIPYIRHTGLIKRDYTIYDFSLSSKVQPNKITVRDYNFTKPSLKLEISEQTNEGDFEVYHHGGLFQKPDLGQKQAQTQLKAFQALKETGEGQSNCVYLTAGKLFKLTEHNNPVFNQEYLIYAVNHSGAQPQSLEEGANGGPSGYSSNFICIPNNVEFKARPPKPTINKRNRFHGIQTATVTGPAGEEIYTDQYSRIKVQFNWDKDGKSNEKSSCWIRVAQPWTGTSWGAIQIPRIGQEILISFVNGDPDRPLIKGVLYNGRNKPPYKLPDQKTKTVVKTCSTPGGQGFNELRFEDKKSKEQIFIHGERDQDIKIENDKDLRVLRDRHLVVDKQNHIHIKQLLSESINGTWKEDLWNDQYITVKQNYTEKAANNYNREAGKEIHIKSAGKIVFDAGMRISVSGSTSYFTLDPSGVKINGPTVRMNTGGSATKTTTSKEKAPEQADEANDKVVIAPAGQGKKKGKHKPNQQPKGSGKSSNAKTNKVGQNSSYHKQKTTHSRIGDVNIIEDIIHLNRYSRPGTKLKDVKGIVIHWVAAPKATAKRIRDYFNNIEKEKRFASAHFVVGLEGEIIKAIPDNEVAYHVGAKRYQKGIQAKLGSYPNAHTLGIECCHIDNSGKMTQATWDSLVSLASSLLKKYNLTDSDLYLHQDVTGKPCHKYFVDNPQEWVKYKNEVKCKM
ncbi:type VI secretion system tip protein TssI/VgrG [Zooshikella harenae]|uniref:N-acetylmuramoyl-L-alanine amidase n=1 Tax=Zooshikella harenae TaxID=2827238 RepID=A0ABS5ZA21_9GAMM|nr:type VI secretion system tip protein TssI/VgrG [Zooshikella harenae]MBU2710830.1 type VI secretion system tip protein VgrG [Zooshikella harenae]